MIIFYEWKKSMIKPVLREHPPSENMFWETKWSNWFLFDCYGCVLSKTDTIIFIFVDFPCDICREKNCIEINKVNDIWHEDKNHKIQDNKFSQHRIYHWKKNKYCVPVCLIYYWKFYIEVFGMFDLCYIYMLDILWWKSGQC